MWKAIPATCAHVRRSFGSPTARRRSIPDTRKPGLSLRSHSAKCITCVAERWLAVDPELAEAHAVKAKVLCERGLLEEAGREIEVAIRLGPDSWEVNDTAGIIRFRQTRLKEATAYWEKAVALELGDYSSA